MFGDCIGLDLNLYTYIHVFEHISEYIMNFTDNQNERIYVHRLGLLLYQLRRPVHELCRRLIYLLGIFTSTSTPSTRFVDHIRKCVLEGSELRRLRDTSSHGFSTFGFRVYRFPGEGILKVLFL